MAERSALSPVCSGLAGLSRAMSLTGIRVGEVISSTVPWAKANPVIAPHVLRLTSAVACCQVGLVLDTGSPSSSSECGLDDCAEAAFIWGSGSSLLVVQCLEDRLDLRVTRYYCFV